MNLFTVIAAASTRERWKDPRQARARVRVVNSDKILERTSITGTAASFRNSRLCTITFVTRVAIGLSFCHSSFFLSFTLSSHDLVRSAYEDLLVEETTRSHDGKLITMRDRLVQGKRELVRE